MNTDVFATLGRVLFEDMATEAARRKFASIKIVSHPPALGFYERMGARHIATSMPEGKVTWSRPVLQLEVRSDTLV